MRWVVALSAGMCVSSLPWGAAAADPPAAVDSAGTAAKVTAEDLYQQGIALARESRWAEAAAKLEESNRLDPAPGTSINLADCYEHLGRLASAWTLFVEAATIFEKRTPPDPRAATAKERAEALYAKLSRLTIEVPEEVRATVGLRVRRDGQEVGAAQLGAAIAVDPGEHVVEVTAPGKAPWSARVQVGADGAKVSVTVPALADAKGSEVGGEAGGWGWQKKAAVGVAAAGVAGLAVGAIFGGLAVGKHDELGKHCAPGNPRVCDAAGIAIAGDEKTVATVSTIGLAAGGALVAAGVVLWLVAPADAAADAGGGGASARRGVWVAPGVGRQTGVTIGGVW